MDFKWNNTVLNINNFQFNCGESNIKAIPLIIDAENYDGTPNTVIMGSGKTNDTIELSGWANETDIATLLSDHDNHNNYNFVFNTTTYSCIITKISYSYKIEDLDFICYYNMTLLVK
jgi:hypothetical protein